MNWRLIFVLLFAFWSCDPKVNDNKKSTSYYDIAGLMDEQLKLLQSIGPSVYKTAEIDGRLESEVIKPTDSIGWAKELIIIKSIDINKPILTDSYELSESAESGRSIIAYTSKYPDDTEVEILLIEDDVAENPIKIHATMETKNELFISYKTIDVTFHSQDEKSRSEERV